MGVIITPPIVIVMRTTWLDTGEECSAIPGTKQVFSKVFYHSYDFQPIPALGTKNKLLNKGGYCPQGALCEYYKCFRGGSPGSWCQARLF